MAFGHFVFLHISVKNHLKVYGMRHFLTFVATLSIVILSLKPIHADAIISGPVCIIDGNTLQVGEKIKNGKCWGGIEIRLHGSMAPKLGDSCTDSNGTVWDCGQEAKETLARMIRMNNVTCYHIDGEFSVGIPISTCLSGHSDLGLEMVKLGMAKAFHDKSDRYTLEERAAKQAKRGLWK
jgi:endonuclease YncB( thermonuclease family)